MRFWRTCVADPWSGGLVAVTVALFVALQGFVGSFAYASGPSHLRIIDGFVVCTLTGARLAPARPDGQIPANSGRSCCCCCCAIMSSQGKLLPAAIPTGTAFLLVGMRPSSVYHWPVRPREHTPAIWRVATASARAPPLLSV